MQFTGLNNSDTQASVSTGQKIQLTGRNLHRDTNVKRFESSNPSVYFVLRATEIETLCKIISVFIILSVYMRNYLHISAIYTELKCNGLTFRISTLRFSFTTASGVDKITIQTNQVCQDYRLFPFTRFSHVLTRT